PAWHRRARRCVWRAGPAPASRPATDAPADGRMSCTHSWPAPRIEGDFSLKAHIMPGNPAQPESNRRTRRGPPGFVSTRFWPFLILFLRHAEVLKMRGGLRLRTPVDAGKPAYCFICHDLCPRLLYEPAPRLPEP